MYSWLNLLSSSNISLHRWSSLVSLPNRVRLLARLIVLVLETRARARMLGRASALKRERELAINLYRIRVAIYHIIECVTWFCISIKKFHYKS